MSLSRYRPLQRNLGLRKRASGTSNDSGNEKLSGTPVLFGDIDGHFPNHHPNPVDPETLAILRQSVAKADADLGIGFDGDGDRLALLTQKAVRYPVIF